MLRNYFKIAIRNLWRNKGIAAINVCGLALGIATCLLILTFVLNELSYDRYNEKANQIVRVIFHAKMQGGNIDEANVMPPVAQVLRKDFAEVLDATRIRPIGNPRVTYGGKMFQGGAFAFVDSNFFQVFTLPLIKGDAKTALLQPNSVVVSKAEAVKYFGDENPIGKVIHDKDNNVDYKVTGEINEVPVNSHFHLDLFASMATFPPARGSSWMESNFFTYLVLPKGYDYKELEAKLPGEVDKYLGPQLQQGLGVTMSEFKKQGNLLSLKVQPLTDIHLHSGNLTGDLAPYGNITYVYIFSVVAIFMLLIACINFMNLSTASASKRAREVGIRKVMGSLKMQLVRQFLVESLLLTAVAMVLALALVYTFLPLFNSLAGQNLTINFRTNSWIIPALLLFGLFTGVFAGSYPAFFLSSFNPITVLKGSLTQGKKSVSLRSGLVVFQFFISIGLIIGSTIAFQQLSYIHNTNLGYDKGHVLIIENAGALGKNDQAFNQQLLTNPQVLNVSESGYLPAGSSFGNNNTVSTSEHPNDLIKALQYDVDYNYIPALGMQMKTGRNFSKAFASDSTGMVINETAAKAFGWGDNAIGHSILHNQSDGSKISFHVIGVVKDFHFKSLHELITPLVMVMAQDYSNIIVKVKTSDMPALLAGIKKQWDAFKTDNAFSYSFLDDRYNDVYKAEANVSRILGIFAGLTIFVACLGLFGLATFTAEQRTKEIGIRKVLGADISQVVALLSKDFLKLILIAFIIASPVAWYVMNKWLLDFAYRININFWVFVIAGLAVGIITLLTVSYQSIKAALMNPVKSLKTE